MKYSFLLHPIGLLICAPVCGQQWYCMNPTYANSPPNCTGMVGFEAGGKFYYGFGTTAMGQIGGSFEVYDPATNSQSFPAAQVPGRSHCVAFSVNGYGYVGAGNVYDWFWDTTYVTSFIQRYDHVAEQFVWGTHFAGGPRLDAVAFTIGNLVYMGGGLDVDTALGTAFPENDLWAFDPVADTWTSRADMPADLQKGISFVLNGKGYVLPDASNVLWEFDPVPNTWSVRAPYPGTALEGRCAFALNGLGYVGTGNAGTPDVQIFFSYDPMTDTWTSAPSMWASGGRSDALTCVIGNSAYVLGGDRNANTVLGDLWRFGPATTPAPDTWTQRPFLPAGARSNPISFSIGDKGYLGGGTGQFGNLTDFWMYDPAAMTWTARAALPANAAVGFSIDGTGYVHTSAATGNFFAFDPIANSWSPRADMPGGARSLHVAFATEGRGYVAGGVVGGVRSSDLFCYDPIADNWTQCASVPGSPRHSSCAFAIGNKGYYVNGNVAGSSTTSGAMYRYDPLLNTWTVVSNYPYNTNGSQNAMAFTVGNKAYVGGGIVGGPFLSRRFHVYDAPTNTWTQLTALGGGFRYSAAGFSIGEKGYICAGQHKADTNSFSFSSERDNDLWEFNPSIINVSPRVFLDGPFDALSGLMHDSLRTAGLLPSLDPYGAHSYPYPGGNYSDIPSIPPSGSGSNAIVDRVVVELRSAINPAIVLATRHVWLQRDGDVVDMDGTPQIRFTLAPGDYHLAVRHRNHLGAMTAAPVALGSASNTVDLTLPATATYGTDARKLVGPVATLWTGDATFDGMVKYTGSYNDRDAVLLRIGGLVPTNTVNGYHPEDVNMDGVVKYTGTNNDRDAIFLSLGAVVPTTVRHAQLP